MTPSVRLMIEQEQKEEKEIELGFKLNLNKIVEIFWEDLKIYFFGCCLLSQRCT